MNGEFIIAVLLLIVLFYSEWKARRTFDKVTESQYEEGIAFYNSLRGEE